MSGEHVPELSPAEQSLVDLIDEAAVTALTTALVEAPSENPGGTEGAAVEILEKACRALGFAVDTYEVAAERPNLIATLPGGDGPGLMFLGHSDVVPAGPNWTADPYTVRTRDGRLYGRGTTDMKGGIASVVAAMSVLSRARDFGVGLSGPVRLVCTVDEEEHGIGVRDFVGRPADSEFLGCIVAEPTDMQIVRGCRGASYIEIEVTGRAAHSGRPADGRSAINAAAAIVDFIRADHEHLHETLDDLLGCGTWNVGTIQGGQGISVVAPTCSLGIDRRLMPFEDPHAVAGDLRKAIRDRAIDTDGITVDVRVTMEMPGFATAADHPLVTAAVGAVTDSGTATSVGGWSAACDGGFVSRDLGIPSIVLGPGNINTDAHQPDESVAIADLVTAAKAYTLAGLRLLA
ncbi:MULTISPECIES: M20 family metallopeptidase [Gordonia]|uniref:Probable succinyl-diaminopimelate desuccinylase n=1 Tax=Gordonia alkanivorans CGMCC 6845 TaxID=1423140 RepID=W9DKP4_9ACTN|nr:MULTISPECIES: M20 family metallopeptidase [Gordonia]ETA07601.1 acetylornithine deacetylase [Gordonia alkanivorans CGMCC 6845]MDH3008317.1 M20 family metallopeptidase [Gordonia alkanivorans]MDH3012364.1 M20 family metallopeptidase [Gordonia alkanivorans]MDH3017293.1 M20 family metallopeptidase [Gordonia alkanivorans]MDH3021840.1 M20 family metallopeptidase [Gordonia alkanivorans]